MLLHSRALNTNMPQPVLTQYFAPFELLQFEYKLQTGTGGFAFCEHPRTVRALVDVNQNEKSLSLRLGGCLFKSDAATQAPGKAYFKRSFLASWNEFKFICKSQLLFLLICFLQLARKFCPPLCNERDVYKSRNNF